MAKLKAPLFSLQAHGTLADTLTYQSTNKQATAKAVPTHADSRSLAQLRHRFLYQLGIALWNGMASADRAEYVARAVGHSITPMNAWLAEWLSSYPALIAAYPMLEATGLNTFPSGPAAAPFDFHGSLWSTLHRRPAIAFDGVDDYMDLQVSTQLQLQEANYSIILALYPTAAPTQNVLLSKYKGVDNSYTLELLGPASLRWQTQSAIAPHSIESQLNTVLLNSWHIYGLTDGATSSKFYRDGTDITLSTNAYQTPWTTTEKARVGNRSKVPRREYNGHVAFLIVFSRPLSQAEHLAIASTFLPTLS